MGLLRRSMWFMVMAGSSHGGCGLPDDVLWAVAAVKIDAAFCLEDVHA